MFEKMQSNGDRTQIDFARIENDLRNKLIELQVKTKSLEDTQRELAEAREEWYETNRKVEMERREAELLQTQLDVATSTIRRWEEEKTVKRCEQIQTAMHTKTLLRERDSLRNETKNLRLENMMLKQKIEELENIDADKTPDAKSLSDLKNSVSFAIKTANGELFKLNKDIKVLEKSVRAANKLNGRLQTAGMCAYGIQSKYKMRINELEDKLNSVIQFNNAKQ